MHDFYDQLAPIYHLIFEDWTESVRRQGVQLDSIIRSEWGPTVRRVLDAAAGIGTQTLGLLAHGYEVTASDISAVAVARAEEEARARGYAVTGAVADLRNLSQVHGIFDLVLACDNAIPHLLSDAEILQAFQECFRCTSPGGGLLISARDYGPPSPHREEIKPYGVRIVDGTKRILFQVWSWDGPFYDLAFYVTEDRGGPDCRTQVMRSRYYAVPVARLMELVREAGFERVRRIDDQYFQPVVVGTRPIA